MSSFADLSTGAKPGHFAKLPQRIDFDSPYMLALIVAIAVFTISLVFKPKFIMSNGKFSLVKSLVASAFGAGVAMLAPYVYDIVMRKK